MEINVLEEYAAYRIFQLMTPISFRTRLLNVSYADVEGKLDGEHPAFVIEPIEVLAERLGGKELDLPGISRSNLAPDHTARMYVFQYIVANTDWSLVTAYGDNHCCHNGKVLDIDGTQHLVPYDFDRTGLVDASYAEPAREARIRRVTQRRYRGYCMDDESPLEEALRETVALRKDMEAVFRDMPGLDDKDREKDLKFLGKFFERAEDQKDLLRRFRRDCLD